MQLVLPWLTSRGRAGRAERPPAFLEVGAHAYPLTIARHRRARRYVLRMTPEGGLRITVPRGASVAGGLTFARSQGAWIAREWARRAVRDSALAAGGLSEAHMRTVAAAELPARCMELASLHGLTVSRVSIRNQRSRWGSCSSRGAIALNWRLVQMPACVSDYVILHELMHLRQPNHSRQFWREVASVCEGWREAEKWLRIHGQELL
jgi:predicted metal-dependent hydrolase